MNILVTGLATLHWGRLEYGNIGNYYIIVPLFRELHKTFPTATITTTLQLTDEFAQREKINVLPAEFYYGWQEGSRDTKVALEEFESAKEYHKSGILPVSTPYIDELFKSNLIIDFSGDMWGDNSKTMGENRFFVELLKIRVAQLLHKKTVLFASSPGPVTEPGMVEFAKEVYANYDAVINRESLSIKIMREGGFDVTKTVNCACPAWLFNKECYPEYVDGDAILEKENLRNNKKNIGIILATYSLPGNTFDAWEREDNDFDDFIKLIEYILRVKKGQIVLISHSLGFDLPPNFRRKQWRDYKMITRLYEILQSRGNIDMSAITKIDTLYHPWEMHTLIGNLDMLISGRVHGAVAGLEQGVPTLGVDYKNGPLAHKMFGFFDVIGMGEYVVPRDEHDFIKYFDRVYEELDTIKRKLSTNLLSTARKAKEGFTKLKQLLVEGC